MDCYRRKGLYRYSPESKELKSYKAPYHIAGDDVSAICEDAHGQIFVGTLTKVFSDYHPDRKETSNLSSTKTG